MKNWTIKGILLALLCVAFVGVATATSINSKHPVEAGASFAMVAGVAATAFSEKEVAEAKARYGHVKLLTVVVEYELRDIDNLTQNQIIQLNKLGVNTWLLKDKTRELSDRINELARITTLLPKDKSYADIEYSWLADLTGKIINEGEQYEFLVRRPDRNDIKILTTLGKGEDIDGFMDYAQKNLIVGGDTKVLEDGIVYTGFVAQVRSMIQPATSFLQKV